MTVRSYRECCDRAKPSFETGLPFTFPQPHRERTWIDDGGVVWRRRGNEPLPPKQARKLLAGGEVRVLHVYDGAVHEHMGADREGLIQDIEEFWAGNAHPMASFDIAEFRSGDHHVMAMVAESC